MTKRLSPENISTFQNKILNWWEDNRRDFPWRETTDPYKIMVSEFMLQQTQAPRVIERYTAFIKKFPDLQSLVIASKSEILSIWSGLGYNRRVIWLQEASRIILEKESFPKTIQELEKLKGIGRYSARSILIFAFNEDVATIDTNIRRILIAEGFASEEDTEKELFTIAEHILPKGKSRDWHNALMDYGSIVLTVNKTGIKPTSKQNKFKGSDREYRGLILKNILEKKEITLKELSSIIDIPKERLEKITAKMVAESLIKFKSGTYYLD